MLASCTLWLISWTLMAGVAVVALVMWRLSLKGWARANASCEDLLALLERANATTLQAIRHGGIVGLWERQRSERE